MCISLFIHLENDCDIFCRVFFASLSFRLSFALDIPPQGDSSSHPRYVFVFASDGAIEKISITCKWFVQSRAQPNNTNWTNEFFFVMKLFSLDDFAAATGRRACVCQNTLFAHSASSNYNVRYNRFHTYISLFTFLSGVCCIVQRFKLKWNKVKSWKKNILPCCYSYRLYLTFDGVASLDEIVFFFLRALVVHVNTYINFSGAMMIKCVFCSIKVFCDFNWEEQSLPIALLIGTF